MSPEFILWLQALVDGLVLSATIVLGAIGITLTFGILRFANFAHGEYLAWGGYFALSVSGALAARLVTIAAPLDPLSFGIPLIVGLAAAIALTVLLALLLDVAVFRFLRRAKVAISTAMGSFGASLVLRNVIILNYGADPEYLVREIQIAIRVWPGVRITPDQILMIVATGLLVVALHLFLTRTRMGKAMRGVRENPELALVSGIDTASVVRTTWVIGAGLAAIGGVFVGLTVQLRPGIGADLLLGFFAAAILGGIGSIYGAVLGGLAIGLTESFSVLLIGPHYRSAISFLVLILILLVRPQGILGGRR